MSQWTTTEGGALLPVGPRLLSAESAVFRYPIDELDAPCYETSFSVMAELAILGTFNPDFTVTLVRTNVDILPKLLAMNKRAIEAFAKGKSYDDITREGLGKTLGYHPAVAPAPLSMAFIRPNASRLLPIYVKAINEPMPMITNLSPKGIRIRANWLRAFDIPPDNYSEDHWDDMLLHNQKA